MGHWGSLSSDWFVQGPALEEMLSDGKCFMSYKNRLEVRNRIHLQEGPRGQMERKTQSCECESGRVLAGKAEAQGPEAALDPPISWSVSDVGNSEVNLKRKEISLHK